MEDSNHQLEYLEKNKRYHFHQSNARNQSSIFLRVFLTPIISKQSFIKFLQQIIHDF